MQSIGRKEIDETEEFLQNMVRASAMDWGEKMSTWRTGQFGVVEEDFRAWVRDFVHTQVKYEVLEQLREQIEGKYGDMDEAISVAMKRLTAISVAAGITLGLELHRRYCVN